ncbi:MAG: VOC family protein [Chloroflexota bacterium]|nr:VOC family protein [Chloroflexota bacterium]
MIRGIDHLVIACADPDAAATDLESSLGLVAGGGGRHDGLGTFNRIVWLADGSYLELIGVNDREAALQQPIGAAAVAVLDANGGGLATYALRVDELERTVGSLPADSFGPVMHGSRTRTDGERVEWWAAFPDTALAADGVPFLIQHAYVGAEWGQAALAERSSFRHPLGSPVILTRLDLATGDPPSAAATVHERLEIDFWAVADLAVADIGLHVIRLVPRREMAVPAVITLAAEVDSARTVELLGLRFNVERVELPVPAASVDG